MPASNRCYERVPPQRTPFSEFLRPDRPVALAQMTRWVTGPRRPPTSPERHATSLRFVGDARPIGAFDAAEATTRFAAQLLDAAAQVFASKGYDGTKIMDIVKAAGLSSGAVYGRFASKDELLMEAILRQVELSTVARRFQGQTVAAGARRGEPRGRRVSTTRRPCSSKRSSPPAASRTSPPPSRESRTLANDDHRAADPASDRGGLRRARTRTSIRSSSSSSHCSSDCSVQRGAGQAAPDADAWQRFLDGLCCDRRRVGEPSQAEFRGAAVSAR